MSPPARRTKVFRKPTPERLANIALYYLARYAASEGSLRRVLENRVRRAAMQDAEFAADEGARVKLREAIERIIDQHKASGVINDAAFAAMKVGSLRRAGRSAKAITQKLAAKGIAGEMVTAALCVRDEEEGGDQEMAAALSFARKKKLGRFRAPSFEEGGGEDAPEDRLSRAAALKQKNKEVAALARAGFSFDVIRKVLDAEVDAVED